MLHAIPRDPDSPAAQGSTLAARGDIVLRGGLYALRNADLTPHESMLSDLLAVRAVLEASGIAFLLVRDETGRLVLAVDRAARKRLAAALAEAFRDEPFYAKTMRVDGTLARKDDSRPLLLADGVLSERRKAAVFRLYRPRIEPIGRLRYGHRDAFQLELWRFGDEEIEAPLPNLLTRTRITRAEAVADEVELFGHGWPTLQGMFEPAVGDIDFPIDLVFSWVDGSSAEFQRARAARMASYVVGEGDDSEARFRQIDELKYALRSVHMFAPWIRRIFIATDSPAPAWLAEHPQVTIVRSEEFFADLDMLPTHNSHAVEAQLHRIPGLAEHFLYSNDDMFFGRPLQPSLFFSPGGVSKFIEATTRIGLGDNDPARSGHDNAARVNRRLLRERFGRTTTRHLEHCATPLRVSVVNELEAEFPEEFRRTAGSSFRSATDISVTNSLYHYYALVTGRAVEQRQARVTYVETTLRRSLNQLDRLLRRRDQDMFCLNDGSRPELSVEERTAAVTEFLERYFPIPAPWERPATSARAPVPPPEAASAPQV
ncbi:stealth family protein [Gryllotalpicola protaetiae]|uniref:Sugar phosphotransferase n=1 Tax=Gryllotalpicola protaetiae TaxID=2419771 RepID=A0A387BRZ1_9MICO|nr:stealth family protein [Gryllotalpicola protaetiae]AYG03766.1 sugar phosphotransferase [Gryllotalpicola protaetiae]